MTHGWRPVVSLLALALALDACDDSQAWHAPEPGLERMLQQHRVDPYSATSAFADGRSMRTPPPDSVARTRTFLGNGPASSGRDANGYVSAVPLALSRSLLELGRACFEDVCATCHGILGDGVSVVADKMRRRRPPSFFEPRIARQPAGRIFEVAGRGYGLMPGYAASLSIEERWAVVAYVDALRLSRAAPLSQLSPAMRAELNRADP